MFIDNIEGINNNYVFKGHGTYDTIKQKSLNIKIVIMLQLESFQIKYIKIFLFVSYIDT